MTALVRKQVCTTNVMFAQEKGLQNEPVYTNRENPHAACTQHKDISTSMVFNFSQVTIERSFFGSVLLLSVLSVTG